jgi:hypothetical protein
MSKNIVLLPGDGIGPEVVAAGRAVLEAADARFGLGLRFDTHLIGGAAIDATGEPLPSAVQPGPRWRSTSGRSRACWRSVASWACTPTCGR